MFLRMHAPLWYILYFPFEFVIETLLQKYRNWWKRTQNHKNLSENEENVRGKVVVITGANTGLGKHTAKEIVKRGAVVVMGCRDIKKGECARKEIMKESGSNLVELYRLDLSDLSSVRQFAAEVLKAHPLIDILINNAGISLNSPKPSLTKEGWDLTMKTNHLGPFFLTNLLIDSIKHSSIARVVTLSSSTCVLSSLNTNDLMMGKETNMGVMRTKSYENSKLANALFTKSLAKRYPMIKAFSLCPGFVKTDIFRHFEKSFNGILVEIVLFLFGFELEQGAQDIVICSLGRNFEQRDSGGFFRFGKRWPGVENMLRDEIADQVWNISGNLVGIKN